MLNYANICPMDPMLDLSARSEFKDGFVMIALWNKNGKGSKSGSYICQEPIYTTNVLSKPVNDVSGLSKTLFSGESNVFFFNEVETTG